MSNEQQATNLETQETEETIHESMPRNKLLKELEDLDEKTIKATLIARLEKVISDLQLDAETTKKLRRLSSALSEPYVTKDAILHQLSNPLTLSDEDIAILMSPTEPEPFPTKRESTATETVPPEPSPAAPESTLADQPAQTPEEAPTPSADVNVPEEVVQAEAVSDAPVHSLGNAPKELPPKFETATLRDAFEDAVSPALDSVEEARTVIEQLDDFITNESARAILQPLFDVLGKGENLSSADYDTDSIFELLLQSFARLSNQEQENLLEQLESAPENNLANATVGADDAMTTGEAFDSEGDPEIDNPNSDSPQTFDDENSFASQQAWWNQQNTEIDQKIAREADEPLDRFDITLPEIRRAVRQSGPRKGEAYEHPFELNEKTGKLQLKAGRFTMSSEDFSRMQQARRSGAFNPDKILILGDPGTEQEVKYIGDSAATPPEATTTESRSEQRELQELPLDITSLQKNIDAILAAPESANWSGQEFVTLHQDLANLLADLTPEKKPSIDKVSDFRKLKNRFLQLTGQAEEYHAGEIIPDITRVVREEGKRAGEAYENPFHIDKTTGKVALKRDRFTMSDAEFRTMQEERDLGIFSPDRLVILGEPGTKQTVRYFTAKNPEAPTQAAPETQPEDTNQPATSIEDSEQEDSTPDATQEETTKEIPETEAEAEQLIDALHETITMLASGEVTAASASYLRSLHAKIKTAHQRFMEQDYDDADKLLAELATSLGIKNLVIDTESLTQEEGITLTGALGEARTSIAELLVEASSEASNSHKSEETSSDSDSQEINTTTYESKNWGLEQEMSVARIYKTIIDTMHMQRMMGDDEEAQYRAALAELRNLNADLDNLGVTLPEDSASFDEVKSALEGLKTALYATIQDREIAWQHVDELEEAEGSAETVAENPEDAEEPENTEDESTQGDDTNTDGDGDANSSQVRPAPSSPELQEELLDLDKERREMVRLRRIYQKSHTKHRRATQGRFGLSFLKGSQAKQERRSETLDTDKRNYDTQKERYDRALKQEAHRRRQEMMRSNQNVHEQNAALIDEFVLQEKEKQLRALAEVSPIHKKFFMWYRRQPVAVRKVIMAGTVGTIIGGITVATGGVGAGLMAGGMAAGKSLLKGIATEGVARMAFGDKTETKKEGAAETMQQLNKESSPEELVSRLDALQSNWDKRVSQINREDPKIKRMLTRIAAGGVFVGIEMLDNALSAAEIDELPQGGELDDTEIKNDSDSEGNVLEEQEGEEDDAGSNEKQSLDPTPQPAPPFTLDPEAIVQKGDGVSQIIQRQLDTNPDLKQDIYEILQTKHGFQGEIGSPDMYRSLMENYGYMDAAGNEIRLTADMIGEGGYQISVENGAIQIHEVNLDGTEIHTEDTPFEGRDHEAGEYLMNTEPDGNTPADIAIQAGNLPPDTDPLAPFEGMSSGSDNQPNPLSRFEDVAAPQATTLSTETGRSFGDNTLSAGLADQLSQENGMTQEAVLDWYEQALDKVERKDVAKEFTRVLKGKDIDNPFGGGKIDLTPLGDKSAASTELSRMTSQPIPRNFFNTPIDKLPTSEVALENILEQDMSALSSDQVIMLRNLHQAYGPIINTVLENQDITTMGELIREINDSRAESIVNEMMQKALANNGSLPRV